MSNKVDDFLEKLAQQAPKSGNNDFKSKNRSLEKIYLNFPGNFGRYQVLPMDNVVTDFPFSTLFGTREINMPRKNLTSDGQENVYNAWIRILPKNAYIMKNEAGRIVSSLTAADDQLLSQAYMVYDQLFEELDARNNREVAKDIIRKRNYTVFHGMCLNKWGPNDTRTPDRQNFCGLFVCTAKGFVTAIEDNIQERTLMNGGDSSWIPSIYNRLLTGRDGFLMFSIAANKLQAGYAVTATHEIGRSNNLAGATISEEDAALMVDPVASFLGWQANREDESVAPQQRRLFNPALIQEAITFMSQQLAAVRMAKQSGMDILSVIKQTSDEIAAKQAPTNTMGQAPADPALAQMSGGMNWGSGAQAAQPQQVVEGNGYQSAPPVFHADPVTGGAAGGFGSWGQQNVAPAQPKQDAPFSPQFTGNNGEPKDDLPF